MNSQPTKDFKFKKAVYCIGYSINYQTNYFTIFCYEFTYCKQISNFVLLLQTILIVNDVFDF